VAGRRQQAARARDGRARGPATAAAWPAWAVRYGAIAALVLVLVFAAYVRVRVADVPLERDEGEYAYAGQLILQGVPPYSLAYNMKFPGTYYAYSAILALFGESARGIHLGLLAVNAATVVLLFLLTRRLLGDLAATVAAAAMTIVSLDRWIMGVFAHATHFVLPPAIGGLLLLAGRASPRRPGRTLLAGALLGLAVLMKQQAAPFVALGGGWILWSGWRSGARRRETWRDVLVLAAGSLIPLSVIALVFAAQGVLDRFWFWTFQYAREYVGEVPLDEAWPAFLMGWSDITRHTWPVWWLGILGFAALWLGRWDANARVRITLLVGASLVSILPGFFFRQHYFILLLPAVGVLAGVAVATIDRALARRTGPVAARVLAAGLAVAAMGAYLAAERDYLFRLSPRDLSRSVYGANPFVEAPEIARYLASRTAPDDRIVVFGSEPEIYFYANRRSGTGYIYTYALMEPQPYASRMQDEMRREIEAAAPKYIVAVLIGASWLARPNSDQRIITWYQRYVTSCYEPVGLVDIHSADRTTIKWEGEARAYTPISQNIVQIHRRRDAAMTRCQ
jgi:hypothetical protein